MSIIKFTLSLLLLFVWNTETGKVVFISDGDTITVSVNDQLIKVRLYGIDCPEVGHKRGEQSQAFGTAAKEFTNAFCYSKIVFVEDRGYDKYGRLLGVVRLEDGRNLNEELLRAGLAWHYTKYDDNKAWEKLQNEAKEKKKGLWASLDPEAPWDYRQRHR